MKKLEKFIYSFKYLPPILYFGTAGLILLIISLDHKLIELLIPLFIFFIYMTYLVSKNYKSGGRDPIEKLIYSNKYLPPLLYFSSLAWLIYTYYFGNYLGNEIQILGYVWNDSLLDYIFFYWFLYITYLAAKNYKKNKS